MVNTNVDKSTCSQSSKEELRSSPSSSCKYVRSCISSHRLRDSSKDNISTNSISNSVIDIQNSNPNLDSLSSGDEDERLLPTKSTHSSRDNIRSMSPSKPDSKYIMDTRHGTETKLKAWEPLMKGSCPLNSGCEKKIGDDSLRSP
jgi:hypothetical protein